MSSTTISVIGMTCGHCVTAVRTELSRLPGVTDVAIDLHAGSVSPVVITSATDLTPEVIAGAVDEAGYALAPGA
jgi:copper chaperone